MDYDWLDPKPGPERIEEAIKRRVIFAFTFLFVIALAGPTQAEPYPYTLIDPATFGGPQSFLNIPAIPLTKDGTLVGTADTTIPDGDYPNFNPFMVGFPDAHVVHVFAWRNGQLTDLAALPGNNSSAVFEVNGSGVGVGMSETSVTDPYTGWPSHNATQRRTRLARSSGLARNRSPRGTRTAATRQRVAHTATAFPKRRHGDLWSSSV
jgi:hypothetical protein